MHMIKENPLGLCLLVSAQPLEIMKSRKKLDFFYSANSKKTRKKLDFHIFMKFVKTAKPQKNLEFRRS